MGNEMDDKRLQGKVALVTGGGNGIGRACAEELGALGASVVVNDLGSDEWAQGMTSEAADAVVAGIRERGGEAVANYDSVATSEGCRNAVQTGVDAFGKVDIVVGCAGALIEGGLKATDEQYELFMALFLGQKFWLGREVLPGMVERGYGRFITVTSHGATGLLGQPVFAAAMCGVISLTRGIAHEYAGTGVTANCLSPGGATRLHATSRDMFEKMHEEGLVDDEFWEGFQKTPPPEYVSPIVAWLCTDAGADVTGEVFQAGGGYVATHSRFREERTAYRGDPKTTPPWTLEELDLVVPRMLLMKP